MSVTAAISAESPANIAVLDALRISHEPGVNLDDRLRMVPGFSLFRRLSSLAANPTTQGVSLRGLGSTGASRTLVLWDGVPVNSPFGGWIYWTRLDPEIMERIEVSRGASTSVFGDKAMGGAIAMFTRDTPGRSGWLAYEGGTRQTHQTSGGASSGLGRNWTAGASGRAFRTAGYFIVPPEAQGPIDTPAAARFAAGTLRAGYSAGARRLFFRGDALAEERDNGTAATVNSTGLGTAAVNYWQQAGASAWNALLYHTREEYRATFSSIGAGRRTERLTSRQSVPSQATGGAALYQRSAPRWSLLAGGDFTRVSGESRDTLFPSGTRTGGGTQSQYGLYTQASGSLGPLKLFSGLRGHNSGTGSAFWMPTGGLTWGAERWRARLSAYRAFRAPTLNELHREFRAGNAVTLANPSLKPESLAGVEAGGDFVTSLWRISVTAFYSSLDDLITSVTRSVTPALITRQRDNAGGATVRGVESQLRLQWRNWRGDAAWLMADSRFAAGGRIPQTPRSSGSALLAWQRGGTLASAGLRLSALQFEDDRNLFRLPGFAVAQAVVRQRLTQRLAAVFSIENATNRRVFAGFSPTPLVAAPRLWRAGLRWTGL